MIINKPWHGIAKRRTRIFRAQALVWYRRAAAHGSSDAENQLGYMAEKGLGQVQSYSEAFSWYYKGADHGNDEAMENIGYDFQYGSGVASNYTQAISWYYKAAALGNGTAENQLGWMYQYGQGVEQNDAMAVAWYRLAKDQGSVSGENNLHAFKEELEDRCSGCWDSANQPVKDAAIEMVQRRVRIRELRAQIIGLETDALAEDNSADELAHMGNNGKQKNGGIAKAMDALGTVVGEKPRLDAAKSREEGVPLREEPARLESLDNSSANAVVP
jgi:TPR repeat protein